MEDLRVRRRFVRELTRFGENRLGLSFDGSFKKYDPDLPAAHWLYSVYPDRFDSAHSKGVPFRFTWKLSQARAWERQSLHRGLHTYLYSAEAHGGPACPITSRLLQAPRARQAYVVLHEAWHSTLRCGQIRMPYALEEATGRVVGVMGAVQFARVHGDADLETAALNQARDWHGFARWINQSYRQLDRLYRDATVGNRRRPRPQRDDRTGQDCLPGPPHGGKQDPRAGKRRATELGSPADPALRDAWEAIHGDAEGLRARTRSLWEREELTRTVNNAFLFRYYDYTRYYPLALRIYKHTGSLPRSMALYRRAGEEGAPRFLRHAAR